MYNLMLFDTLQKLGLYELKDFPQRIGFVIF